jgi:hypothetical protein
VAYWMLRLFLSDRLKGTLFEDPNIEESQSREQYLKARFSQEARFVHRRRTYVFTPYRGDGSSLLVGVIAREHALTIHQSPEENYKKQSVVAWGPQMCLSISPARARARKLRWRKQIALEAR